MEGRRSEETEGGLREMREFAVDPRRLSPFFVFS